MLSRVEHKKIFITLGPELLTIFVLNVHMNKSNSPLLMFVCVEVLRPSQPSGVMSSAVSLPNHTFTGQA